MNELILILAECILVNGLGECFLIFVWMLLRRFFRRKMDVQLSYILLRVIVAFFCLPIFGIAEVTAMTRYMYGTSETGSLHVSWESLQIPVIVVWLIGVLVLLIIQLGFYCRMEVCAKSGSMSANLRVCDAVHKASSMIGLHRTVECKDRYGDDTAFVMGIGHPVIYFPVREYTEDQRLVIALHELNHVKHGDLFWKRAMSLVHAVYWPLIPVWFLRKYVDSWSEYHCDFQSCQALGNYGNYFDVLGEMISGRQRWYRSDWVATMCKSRGELVERMRYMAAQKKLNSIRCRCIVAATVLFLSAGSVTVMAATDRLMTGYRTVYWDDRDIQSQEEDEGILMQETGRSTTEKLGLDRIPEEHWIDGTSEGLLEETTPDCLFFKEMAEAGESMISVPFPADAGEQIYMSLSLNEELPGVRMGIVIPGGEAVYVSVGTELDTAYCFDCPVAGEYRFFLQNTSEIETEFFGMASVVANEE